MPWFTDTSTAPKWEVSRGSAGTRIAWIGTDTNEITFRRVKQDIVTEEIHGLADTTATGSQSYWNSLAGYTAMKRRENPAGAYLVTITYTEQTVTDTS
jgi:hypothetical protein